MQHLHAAFKSLEGARVLSQFQRVGSCFTSRACSQIECDPGLGLGPSSQCSHLRQQQQQQQQLVSMHQEHASSHRHMHQQQHRQQIHSLMRVQRSSSIRARCTSEQQLLHGTPCTGALRAFSSTSSSNGAEQQQEAATYSRSAARSAAGEGVAPAQLNRQLDELLQVLLHPMPRTASWNGQLSPYLLQVNEQLLLQPSAVLMSVVRALHVLRGVLQENGHVYVVENNQLLRPLVKTAALSCINPNVWFDHRTWSPGTLTNYASSRRLFKESHQPNRRLFAAKGYRPVNPLCPSPPPLATPIPRLSQDDKWLLYRRTMKPGYRQLLNGLMEAEDSMLSFKPAGSLRGVPSQLQLMVFLDSTKNAVAIKEAYNRNIPTIAIVNTTKDMSQVTYPVLARDFSPGFVHFFLDWIVKVANAAPVPQADPTKAK